MKITLSGKLIGCYQDETGFYARIEANDFPKQQAEIPISYEQFYKIRLGQAELTIETK